MAACQDSGPDKSDEETKRALDPACVEYVDAATACIGKADEGAKKAVKAVYDANRSTLDKAKSDMTKQCERWSELLAKNPQCKK